MVVKVLYVITELDIGGAEKALYELARRLDRTRYAAAVACLSGRGEVGGWLEPLGIPVHYLGEKGVGDLDGGGPRPLFPGGFEPCPLFRSPLCHTLSGGLGALLRLARLVRQTRPAIVHTVLFHANLAGRLAAAVAGCCRRRPLVVSAVRVAERRTRLHALGDYLTHRFCDVEVCVSEGVRRHARREARIPVGKLRVIPNGVDVAAIDAVRPADLAALGVRPDRLTIVFVGRLDPQKGLVFLLHALAQLGREAPPWQCLLVGHGPERPALEVRARRLGLSDRVRFLGWRPDALGLVAAADLFVMPSLWEGMPNAVMEAMALGKCVVATAVEGTEDLIENEEHGLLVPPGRARPLREALGRALAQPAFRDRLGRAAGDRIRRNFAIERTVAAYEGLYRELLMSRGPGKRGRGPFFWGPLPPRSPTPFSP